MACTTQYHTTRHDHIHHNAPGWGGGGGRGGGGGGIRSLYANTNFKKFRMQQQGLCVKLRNLTTSILFFKLHWLPVTHCIQFQLSASIPSLEQPPQDLSDLLHPYTPARQLRSASDTRTFVTPRVNTKTFGERFFSYAGPSVWNNLPQTLRHSDSASSFKAALKTHLFNNYF